MTTRISATPTRSRSIRDGGGGVGRAGLVLSALAAACSPHEPSNEVDIGNAARAAQGSVDNQIAPDEADARTRRVARVVSSRPSEAATPRSDDGVAGKAVVSDRVDEAADVVRAYYALIARRDFAAAWRMWDDAGAAAGLSPDAFAASFARYRDYDAEVGAPGAIEGAAGQRYVTVPVAVTGTLRDGARFAMEGRVTLHRVGDIDGASDAQRRWRIHAIDVRPNPIATAPPPAATPSEQ